MSGAEASQPIPDARATRELWPSEAVYQALPAVRREDGRAALCIVLHLVDGERQVAVARQASR